MKAGKREWLSLYPEEICEERSNVEEESMEMIHGK